MAFDLNTRGAASSPSCSQCPCARDGKAHRPVRAYGQRGGFCIVGEGPGKNEILQGYPFCGESGKVVNKALKRIEVDRSSVWITNALLCGRPSDDKALDLAVNCCRQRLVDDLQLCQPTAICALGGTAMRALQLPVASPSQARGCVQYSPLLPGVPVIGSIHPAAILRGGAGEMADSGKQKMGADAQAQFLFSDIEKAARVAAGELSPAWSDDILVVHEPAEVEPALRAILVDCREWGILGLDLEWICEGRGNAADAAEALDALGAEAHRAQITWVGIGCAKRAVSFKFQALVDSGMLGLLQEAMEDPTLAKLAHNRQADQAVWEAKVGPIRGRILDTMLLHHATYPGISHKLQQVASQFLCVPPWKVDHARQILAHKEAEKARQKAEKEAARAEVKAAKQAEHAKRNAEKAAEKAARKAEKQAEHQAKQAAMAAERERKKAEKQAAHEARNRETAEAAEARKAAKRGGGVVARVGGQTHLITGRGSGEQADAVLGDILDPPEPYTEEPEDGTPGDPE